MRRAIAALAIALCAVAVVAATAIGVNGDVLIPDTQSDADYHAEGRIALGGNIEIQSDRAPATGQALQNGCDPDPRPAPNNRPGCSWATPQGNGREQVNLQGQIGRPDTDRSPNKAYTPDSSDTREILNGLAALQHDHSASAARVNRKKLKARAAQSGQRFEGDFFNDEDMHFRLTPRTLDAYLAPEGNANNRWRRICGTGVVEQFNNSGNGNNDPRSPFLEGQVRKFVLQIWDADWREPSNSDGGNQDYYIIDILAPGSNFDVNACQAANPQNPQPAQPGQPAQPAQPAPPVAPAAPSQSIRGSAALNGPRGCQSRAFRASIVGSNIAQVVYLLDGKRYRTLTKATSGNRWSAQIVPSKLKVGTHRVTAGVSFVAGATPRVRAMSFSFKRCAKAAQVVRPRFTG